MIRRDYEALRDRLEKTQILLKNTHDEAERIALSNYIGNLYDAMNCMGDESVPKVFQHTFPNKRKYKTFLRGINIYSDELYKNFIVCKDFHQQFLGEVVPEVELDIYDLCAIKPIENEAIPEKDFFEILYMVLASIGFDEEFDKLYKNSHIFSNSISHEENNLGFTLYNPVNHDVDLFVRDFKYTYNNMSTLIHEFGHSVDLTRFNGSIDDYNSYFYRSFYGETLSRLMERVLYNFCIKNNILVDQAKDTLIDFEDLNHDYLLTSYVISLLDDDFIRSGGHMKIENKDVIARKVCKHFNGYDSIRDFIEDISTFDISENFTYAYGDIISMFLMDEIENNGFSSELFEYFMSNRHKVFSEEFMRECGFGPLNYAKLYKKEIELIKK